MPIGEHASMLLKDRLLNMMIDAEDAVRLLVASIPGSTAALTGVERYLDAHPDIHDALPPRALMGSHVDALAHFVFERAASGDCAWFPVLFAAIEFVLTAGDEEARLRVRGLLHWLYIASGSAKGDQHQSLRRAVAEQLGPVSQQAWDEFAMMERTIRESVPIGKSPEGYVIMRGPGHA